MTYFGVLFTFIIPPMLALAAWAPRDLWRGLSGRGSRGIGLPYQAILLHVAIALVYTTPWDNYLVATGVWWYDPRLVTGITLGWVPIEEYTFFILQTLLTGLWTVWMMRRLPAQIAAGAARENLPMRIWASLIIVALWAGSLAVWVSGWQPGVYLSLILAWALPPILLQAAFGMDILFARWRALLVSIAGPTLYLWMVDSLAITSGTWTINPLNITGIRLGTLPMEEMLFFAITNVLIASGILLLCAPESLQRLRQIISRVRLLRNTVHRGSV